MIFFIKRCSQGGYVTRKTQGKQEADVGTAFQFSDRID